ncbi:hypothetical protein OROMI_022838 [Orobanche minor]
MSCKESFFCLVHIFYLVTITQVTCGSVNHQHNILDIAEFERLESMVEIPPIDDVINDGMSRLMATRWLDHFTNKFKLQAQNVLYCTPSVPLSLVVLPDLFEDLIKASGCRAHAMACGAGIGAFLVILNPFYDSKYGRKTMNQLGLKLRLLVLSENKFKFSLYQEKRVLTVPEKLQPCDGETDLGGVDDMTKLTYLNDPGVLDNLRRRYAFNEIYDLNFRQGKPLHLDYKRYLDLTETFCLPWGDDFVGHQHKNGMPNSIEAYTHRTGRAGKTFLTVSDNEVLYDLNLSTGRAGRLVEDWSCSFKAKVPCLSKTRGFKVQAWNCT